MSVKFPLEKGLIIIPVRLTGAEKIIVAQFAVDTGATHTLINTDLAVLLGYDPAISNERIKITTGSGIVYASKIIVNEIYAIKKLIKNFQYSVIHCLQVHLWTDCWGSIFFINQQ